MNLMSRRLSLSLLVLCSVLALAQLGQAQAELWRNPKPAPAVVFHTVNGKLINLKQYRGEVVLLNFWATWCGPCRMEIPNLARLQAKYPGRLQVLGLSVDDDASPAQVGAFAKQLGVNYPVGMAGVPLRMEFGGITAIPSTFLVDPQGRIAQWFQGLHPISEIDADARALMKMPDGEQVTYISRPLLPGEPVKTIHIPGIYNELAALPAAKQKVLLSRLNKEHCTCPCHMTLAHCRTEDTTCPVSLQESKKLIIAAAGK